MSDMKCDEVRAAVLDGEQVFGEGASEELVAHLETCAACAGLYAPESEPLLQEVRTAPALGQDEFAALREQIGAAIEQEDASLLGKLRSFSQRKRWLLALSAVVVAVAFGLLRARVDLAVYPGTRMLLVLLPQSVLTLLLCGVLLRPIYSPSWFKGPWLWLGLALAVPAVLAGLPQAHSPHPDSLLGVQQDWFARAAACALWGTMAASPFVAVMIAMDRFAGGRRSLWLSVAASGGVVANLALQLHCPLTHPVHLMPGHALVGVLLMIVVAFSARWVARAKLPEEPAKPSR